MAERAYQDRPEPSRRRILVQVPLNLNLFIPFLFLATIVAAFIVIMGESSTPQYIKFTSVAGFFQQEDAATESEGFDYTMTNFGLIDQAYDTDAEYDPDHAKTQWQRFGNKVAQLNLDSGPRIQYKVLYMGRHGQGYHNAAESYYGRDAWNCYWSLQDGNGTVTWADALLTTEGEAQALKANAFWSSQITTQKIPTPESYYSSPLTRCLDTANLTFSGLDLPAAHPFVPTIKELFREVNGVHTCDRRSSKTFIHNRYPEWKIEDGFQEEDELWSPTLRESEDAIDERNRIVLTDVFENDRNTWISLSIHFGEISSILRVLGHRRFALGTGQVIPVLVKAEVVDGPAPYSTGAPWNTVSTCSTPPPLPTL